MNAGRIYGIYNFKSENVCLELKQTVYCQVWQAGQNGLQKLLVQSRVVKPGTMRSREIVLTVCYVTARLKVENTGKYVYVTTDHV